MRRCVGSGCAALVLIAVSGCTAPRVEVEEAPPLEVVEELRVDDVFGADLAFGPDGSLFVVGGKTEYAIDWGTSFRDFWMARVNEHFEVEFEVHEVLEAELDADSSESYGIGVAWDGVTVTTIAERYVDGERTRVRRFDADGTLLDEELLLPGYSWVRALPDGQGVVFAGSELVEWNGGRPFTEARIDRVPAAGGAWPTVFRGNDGSISEAISIAVDGAGNVSVGGILGTERSSNAGMWWLARLAPDGETLFSTEFEPDFDGRCTIDAVAVTDAGTTLAIESCEGGAVVAYSPEGDELWREETEGVTFTLAALPGGYVLSTGEGGFGSGEYQPSRWTAELLVYDDERRLRHRVEEPDCMPFHRLLVDEVGIIGVAECSDGMRLTKYALPEWSLDAAREGD